LGAGSNSGTGTGAVVDGCDASADGGPEKYRASMHSGVIGA